MPSRFLTILAVVCTFLAVAITTAYAAPSSGDPTRVEDPDGRQLRPRRRRRGLAGARLLHNATTEALPSVDASLRGISASLAALSAPRATTTLDARCHAREHTGYAGDGAAVWGLSFKLKDAGECCDACKAHAAVCGSPDGAGKSWWPERPEMKCGRDVKKACTIWTFCPVDRCFAFDIHKHGFGECWLKYQGDDPPYTRPKDPHFGHQTYPEVMRNAPRKRWPWPVAEDIWQGPSTFPGRP